MQRPRPLLLVLSFAFAQGLFLMVVGTLNLVNAESIVEDRNEELWSDYSESVASLESERSAQSAQSAQGPTPSSEGSSTDGGSTDSSSIKEPAELTVNMARTLGGVALVLGLAEVLLSAWMYLKSDKRARLPLLVIMVIVGAMQFLGIAGLAVALFGVYALAMNIPTRRFLDPSFVPPVNRRMAAAQAAAEARAERAGGGSIDATATEVDPDERSTDEDR